MAKTVMMTQGLDGWVRLDLGKGCILKLSAAAYYAGIAAGKAEQRGRQQAHREAAGQAHREADSLRWIDND
jgi:hypothetical protein